MSERHWTRRIEPRIYGVLLVLLASGQYLITARILWRAWLPPRWLEASHSNLASNLLQEIFWSQALFVAGPVVSGAIGLILCWSGALSRAPWLAALGALGLLLIADFLVLSVESPYFAPSIVSHGMFIGLIAFRCRT